MRETDWKALYDSLEKEKRGKEKPVSPPTDRALNKFERDTGCRLPLSYREFIKAFGPGELGGQFLMKSPGYKKYGRSADLMSCTTIARSRLPEFCPGPRTPRIFYFCETIFGDLIGWDPKDVRDAATHEYGIYICVHEFETCDFLVGTFREFINKTCLSKGLAKALHVKPADYEPPTRTFLPFAW
jgi:hypothetical protein